MKKIAEVIVDISTSEVDKIFSYSIEDDGSFSLGDRVIVPFGKMRKEGFIVGIKDFYETAFELKDISLKLDEYSCIIPEMIELMEYMKTNLHLRYIDSLRLFIPNKLRGNQIHEATEYYIQKCDMDLDNAKKLVSKLTKQRSDLLDYIYSIDEIAFSELKEKYSTRVIDGLVSLNVIKKEERVRYRKPYKDLIHEDKKHVLTLDQQNAVGLIKEANKPVLLKGVTGSGKTEVYMNLISDVVNSGKRAIMLVPEISLTPQTLKIFKARFGDRVALLHSALSDGERFDEWRRILFGEVDIVVGARSAIFAPIKNVGIIVIDEEHDGSYSSDSNPRYNTIDIALFRSRFNNAKVVMGSATPSIDTFYKVQTGEYELVRMDNRVNDSVLPEVKVIDMNLEIMKGNTSIFSALMQNRIKEEVDKGNQVMVFLNRRGYSSYITCLGCGYTPSCLYCDSKLFYHKNEDLLVCHYCDRKYKRLLTCPKCGSKNLKYGRVGTQKIEEDIFKIAPNAKVLRMDNDTTRRKDSYIQILEKFRKKEANVLVGTQMIAKGHDFPDVTLVCILDADLSFYSSDYRSNERTFQLITQVAGRAGRSEKKGEVLLQTYQPRNHVIFHAIHHNYDGFFKDEIKIRETTFFPPFSYFMRILVLSKDEKLAYQSTKIVYTEIKDKINKDNFIFLQANKAMKEFIDSKFRYHILMRIVKEKEKETVDKIFDIVENNKKANVSIFIELDPKNLY